MSAKWSWMLLFVLILSLVPTTAMAQEPVVNPMWVRFHWGYPDGQTQLGIDSVDPQTAVLESVSASGEKYPLEVEVTQTPRFTYYTRFDLSSPVTLRVWPELGGLMESTWNKEVCKDGPMFSIVSSADGTTWVDVQNLWVGTTIYYRRVDDQYSQWTQVNVGMGVGQRYWGEEGKFEFKLSPTSSQVCATLQWNWTVLSNSPVMVKVENSTFDIGTGNELTISLNDLNGRQLTDFQLAFTYAPEMVALEEIITEGTLSQGWQFVDGSTPGLVKLAAQGVTPITGDGTLLKLRFSGMQSGSTSFTFDPQFSSLNGGNLPSEWWHTSLNVLDLTIHGKVTYGNGQPIPNMTAYLNGPSNDQQLTDLNGNYILTAATQGDYIVGFQKPRHEDQDDAFSASDASKALRCAVQLETCPEASDADEDGGVDSHDAYLIAMALLNSFPEESRVGEWICNSPFVLVTLHERLENANMSCWLVGDSTLSWHNAVIATAIEPQVSFGEPVWTGDLQTAIVPITIRQSGLDGAAFTLSTEGEIAEVVGEGWSVLRSGNRFVIYGSSIVDELTVHAIIKAKDGDALILSDLQVGEQPMIDGEVARTTITNPWTPPTNFVYLPLIGQ